jgi:hypothetical protein
MSPTPPDTAKSKQSASSNPSSDDLDVKASAEPNASAKRKRSNSPIGEAAIKDRTPADVSEDEEEENGNDRDSTDTESEAGEPSHHGDANASPLPNEDIPPLPQEPLPVEDDGWQPVWDQTNQAFYFYNRFTGATQWDNPRVPEATQVIPPVPGIAPVAVSQAADQAARPAGGYDPSIHGDYDPNAWYAQPAQVESAEAAMPTNAAELYAQTGAFNRFTGRWQAAEVGPELHNDENKSKRQMNAFFDVDAAANSHDGRSLKAERSGKKLSKTELKQFKEKRKAKKEEKRRAWLRD